MTPSLKERAVRGVSWNLVEKAGNQFIRFFLGIILARLLMPEDYGLIGMVTVFFVIARVFSDGGFGQAYVQKKEVSSVDANTMFYTNLVVSILAYSGLWFGAPAIAKFYGEQELIALTRVLGLVVLISAFNMIQLAQIKRAINFKRKTKITLIASLTGGLAGVFFAYKGFGVWALVIQQLSNVLLTTLGLWITSDWKPKLEFSFVVFKEMFSFGSWILSANLIKKFFDNIYVLVIGKFFPAAQLGYYTKAKAFEEMASKQIALSVGVVSFPIFSKWQNDTVKLQNGMKQFLKHTMFLIVPILITLIIVAKPFVILLLTEKWAPMIPYLQLLCVLGLIYPVALVNFQLILAKGKSKLGFYLDLVRNGLRIVNLIIMFRFGVVYIILGEIIVNMLTVIITSFYINKLINYNLLTQIFDIRKTLIAGLIAMSGGYFATKYLPNLWLIFIIGAGTTLFIYTALQFIFNRKLFIEFVGFRNIIHK